MLRKWLMLCGITLICLTTSVAAQSVAPLRLGVALGTSFGDEEWWWPDGGHAALSLTSRSIGSRFGLRVETIFGSNTTSGFRLSDGSPYVARDATLALTVNLTYRLVGRETGLYAIGGIGVYHRWSEARFDRFPIEEEVRHGTMAGTDANLGLGFDFRAFGRELFVESRIHGNAFGERVPLSLGIRF
jgi:hypothetical protein